MNDVIWYIVNYDQLNHNLLQLPMCILIEIQKKFKAIQT